MRRLLAHAVWTLSAALFPAAGRAAACAVCNGQDDHAMTEGAKLAVVLLGAITYVLLTGVAIVVGVWIVRARRLAREEEALAGKPPQG